MSKLPSKNTLLSQIDSKFFVVVIIAVLIFSGTLYLLASKVDELAIKREQSQFQNSLHDDIIDIEAVVLPTISWDEAVLHLENHYDPDWAETNIGHFFCVSQGFSYVYILDPTDQLVFSMRNNQTVHDDSFQSFREVSEKLLATIRAREAQRGLVFTPIEQGGVVSKPIQESGMVKAGDDLVIFTFTLVQPDFGVNLPKGARAPIVMTGKLINAKFLHHFSDRLILSNLHLASLHASTEATVNLNDPLGRTIGQLAWTPYRPASHLIAMALLPILLGIGAPLILYFYSRRTSALLRKTLTELRASDERWSFALEGGGEGVWDWDIVNNKVQLSTQWKAMLGFEEQEVGDAFDDWLSRIHPDDLQQVMSAIQENIEGKNRSFSVEHRVLCKDGSELWVLNRGMAVNRHASGAAQRMVGTFADISKHKHMELMKSQFVSSVSHELRTPVTSIRGALGLLDSGVLGELPLKAREMVAIAHKNSLRLLNLVNDILDMDKLIYGKVVFRSDPVELVGMVMESIEANTAYGNSFNVSYSLTEKIDNLNVVGDFERILQVMANLLSNAAKFSLPGSVVAIRISEMDGHAKIEIENNGQAIPADFQAQIFSPFAQASNGDTRKQGGTGLGLNISKKMIENMKGTIGFSSSPEVGTIFWFTLPKHPSE